MTAAKPYDWIQEVEETLAALDQTPQFGLPLSFPWEACGERLGKVFSRPELKLTHTPLGWVDAPHLFDGLGSPLCPLKLEWSPILSSAFFVTTEHDIKLLMAELMGGDRGASFFYDPSLVTAFYTYFGASALGVIEELKFAAPLNVRMGDVTGSVQEMIGNHACFSIDVSLKLNQSAFTGRILLPDTFRDSFKAHFAHLPPPRLTEEKKRQIVVDLPLEVGYSRLSFADWGEVKQGDCILLDHCSYDPEEGKGSVVIKLGGKPIYRGRFKEEGIKLTNYPVYEEVASGMEEDEPFEEEDEEDLYGDLDEEFDLDEDEEEEEEDLFPETSEEEESEEKEVPEEEEKVSAQLAPEEEGPKITPEKLPVHLTVEVGRLRMTAQELLNLAPGNLIDLKISPEQGVDLVLNGKKVGRGELIRMGETLGVRILSL